MNIKVQSTSDIHKYILDKECKCGGRYKLRSSSVDFNETRDFLLDNVTIQCLKCNKILEIQFSVPVMDYKLQQPSAPLQDIKRNWTIPRSGPYIVQEREYKIRLREMLGYFSSGQINHNEFSEKFQTIYNETYPKIAGRYQIIGVREGVMGNAYLCYDTRKPGYGLVVCKTLKIEPDDIEMDSLKKEAVNWVKLGNHSNLVDLYDVFLEGNSRLILVTQAISPFAKAISLEDFIKSDERIDVNLQIKFFFDLVKGILHCQQRIDGFIHGDLKPSNLLISEDKTLKVTDFGLVITKDFNQLSVDEVYTDEYLAPECFKGEKLSEYSDVYAFGIIMYESLTGKYPYGKALDREDLIYRHKNTVPSLIEGIDLWLWELIQECLKKNKSERPTFKELYNIFQQNVPFAEEENVKELPHHLNNAAVALQSMGQYKEAMGYLIKTGVENVEVLYNMATILSKSGDKENSESIYNQFINSPNLPAEVYANYAAHILRYYKDENKLKDGVEFCERALALDKYNLVAHINKCAILNSIRCFSEARDSAYIAKKLYPKNCNILLEYATANYGLRKWGKALTFANRALKLDPTFKPAQILKEMIESASDKVEI